MTQLSNAVQTISFTEPFIERLADYIDEHYLKQGKPLDRLGIVFGGRRPVLFLNRELSRRAKTLITLPHAWSIDEFIAWILKQHLSFDPAQPLEHSFILYNIIQKHCPNMFHDQHSFAESLPWLQEILGFMDQIDLEDIALEKLENLQAHAKVGFHIPDSINELLRNIAILRNHYHAYQKEHGSFTRGFQYYLATHYIKETSLDDWDEMIWGNFFYFNKTEEQVALNLYERGKALFFFQGDQRKWPVFKHMATRLDQNIMEGKTPDQTTFDLKLYAGFDAHSQTAIAHEIVKTIPNPEKAVIVLPESESLIPLLSSLASTLENFNVSMGYPLKRSSIYTLLSLLIQAQQSRKQGRYYARDYLKVLAHPFIKNSASSQEGQEIITRIIVHKIEEVLTGQVEISLSGMLFVDLGDIIENSELIRLIQQTLKAMDINLSVEDIVGHIDQMHQLCFSSLEKVTCLKDLLQSLQNILDLLDQQGFAKRYPLNQRIHQYLQKEIDRLKGINFVNEPFAADELFDMFMRMVDSALIAFQGSPLKGLQILGLFETRSLSFDDVIVLDANEGVLPHMNLYKPLIPREVMIQLNLDSLENEEEIQRYHFMRLISSAKRVHLVHQQGKDKVLSRFVEELIWEKEQQHQEMHTVPIVQSQFHGAPVVKERGIPKTPEVIDFLKNFTYSASSLNTYLRSPIDFYFQYVLGLRAKENLLDDPENKQIGIFIHNLLENIYKPYVGQAPNIDQGFMQKFNRMMQKEFDQYFAKPGKTDAFLMKSILENRLARFWQEEQKTWEHNLDKVLSIEEKFDDVWHLPSGSFRFVSKVDRVDQHKDGSVIIVDYKTGASDPLPQDIAKLQHIDLTRDMILEHVKSLQMPLYFYALSQRYQDVPINACFYNLRTIEKKYFVKLADQGMKDEILQFYAQVFDAVLAEIIDPNIPFKD